MVEFLLGQPRRVHYSKGYHADYYLDDKLLASYLESATREAIDHFVNASTDYFNRCLAEQRPALYLIKLGSISFTPYSREAMTNLVAQFKHLQGRGAYVFTQHPISTVMRNFIMHENRKAWPGVDFMRFDTPTSALTWLYEGYIAQQNRADNI